MANVQELLERVREKNPLIHNITNIVVANFSANGLLALGASPVMADAVEEASDMAQSFKCRCVEYGNLKS